VFRTIDAVEKCPMDGVNVPVIVNIPKSL
jgi:hypothetical protein